MKKIILLVPAFILLWAAHAKAQVLTQVDSIQFTQAQIWGVLSDDGDSLCATTTFTPGSKPHIYMRKISYADISQQSALKQLTFDADFNSITNLTDHKSMIHNNEIYVSFSTIGDQDLFIFKTDINGNRIGNIVTVVQGSTDPTNDMILSTDGTNIFVLHFDPPNQSRVHTFDTNLNPVGSPFTTTTLAHNNIGQAVYNNSEFYLFTGSAFGFNTNLILTRWNNAWNPTIGSPITLVNTSNGDGNWFSTGAAFDQPNQRLYIGMNHIYSNENIGQEHIDLLAFDNNLNVLQRSHISPNGCFRPHFVLKNNSLYVSYDRAGQGVYLLQYNVSVSSAVGESSDHDLHVFPNPSDGKFRYILENGEQLLDCRLYDVCGALAPVNASHGEITTNAGPGLYFLEMVTNKRSLRCKVVVE
jgi:hypothetical protein